MQVCVCYNTRKAARAITRMYDDMLRPSGLRATQLTLLMVIDALSEPSITTLAEQLVMDRTTLARGPAAEWRRPGWVDRLRQADDRRMRIVRLTAAAWRHCPEGCVAALARSTGSPDRIVVWGQANGSACAVIWRVW